MPAEQEIDAPLQQQADAKNPDPVNPDAPMQQMPDAPPPPPPPDACVPMAIEHLTNPVFDLTPNGTGWTAVRDPQLYPIVGPNPSGLVPVSAPNKAWFGGAAGNDLGTASVTDSLHQDVTFPATATTFVVSGYYVVGGIEVTNVIWDRFTLDVIETNGTPIENVLTLNNTQNTGTATFVPFTKTLTANLAGRTVRLRGTSTNDISDHTSFFIDSLSFKATHCP